MDQRLMAVVRYDQAPFCWAAEIEEIRNDGYCRCKGYDSWYHPIRILPYDPDRILALADIARAYIEGVQMVRDQCKEDIHKLFFIE